MQNILVSKDSSPSCCGNLVKLVSVLMHVQQLKDGLGKTHCEVAIFVENPLMGEDTETQERLHGGDDGDWYYNSDAVRGDGAEDIDATNCNENETQLGERATCLNRDIGRMY